MDDIGPRVLTMPLFYILFFCLGILFFPASVAGDEFTSSSFKVLDPVFQQGGGDELSSTNFRLRGSIEQIAIGTSSASSFIVCSGFLCFSESAAAAAAEAAAPTVPAGGGGLLELGQSFALPRRRAGEEPTRPEIKIEPCGTADFNCDQRVSLADLSTFLYLSGYPAPDNPADINRDGSVDLADASILFSRWTNTFVSTLFPPKPAPPAYYIAASPGARDAFILGSPRSRYPRWGIQREAATPLLRGAYPEQGATRRALERLRIILLEFGRMFASVLLAISYIVK